MPVTTVFPLTKTLAVEEHKSGIRKVVIREFESAINGERYFQARLYYDGFGAASMRPWTGKTLKGARQWAQRVLQGGRL